MCENAQILQHFQNGKRKSHESNSLKHQDDSYLTFNLFILALSNAVHYAEMLQT